MTPIELIATALSAAGVAPIYVMEGAPDSRDAAISLTPYMGEPVPADQAIVADVQRIQAYVRGKRYVEAYELSWRAYRAVLGFIKQQTVFEDYRVTDVMQSPTYIGKDEKGRYLLSFNFQARRTLEN